MNWYKIAQLGSFELSPTEINPMDYYMGIGHKSFFGLGDDCVEWLWVWDGEKLDIRRTGDADVNHGAIWGPAENFMFKGRVSECDEKISIAFPKGDRSKNPPKTLVNQLLEKFPGMTVYLFHR